MTLGGKIISLFPLVQGLLIFFSGILLVRNLSMVDSPPAILDLSFSFDSFSHTQFILSS